MKAIKIIPVVVSFCFVSLNLFSQNLPAYVPSNGLLGWWGFTGNADDESGNGNNGVVNGALPTEDRFSNPNSAYSFNGTTDYIEVADAPPLRLSNTDFTISFWVKIDTYTTPATAFIVKRGNSSSNGWLLVANSNYSNRLEFKVSQGADPSVYSDSTLSIGAWHHVAVVYNQATTFDFYFDGVLTNSESSLGLFLNANSTSVMRFGHDTNTPPGNYFLNGSMDDIGIWSRALTTQEIFSLFSGTTTSARNVAEINYGVYPNPVNDVIHINSNSVARGTQITISDIAGRLLITTWVNDSNSVDVSMLQSGVYFIQVGNQLPFTQKFIKN